jgi:hypothetical protein
MAASGRVIIELAVGEAPSAEVLRQAAHDLDGLVRVDPDYGPVPSAGAGGAGAEAGRPVLIRGALLPGVTAEQVEAVPGVIKVWSDAPLAPFADEP